MNTWTGLLPLLGLFFTAASLAYDLGPPKNNWQEPEVQPWVEEIVAPPAFPRESDVLPIYVNEMTSHRFFVDGSTLSVGKDGLVRYVLFVRTSGGATNVTYEGIRCEQLEYKIYASGRQDGTWALTRKPEWRGIENKPLNRHHAALSRDYFCPNRSPIVTADEGRNALRLGKHPGAR